MRSLTAFCAPFPSAIIVITAETPITTPSMVNNDRIALTRSDAKATRMIS
ncbi:MAG: hypothetical protein ABI852_11590 [Gemmatimonadaceae bacterium]